MKEIDKKAQSDIPGLRVRLSRLFDIVTEMVKGSKDLSDEDHFRFMNLCFLCRQLEHTESVLILINEGREMDAQLISRSMTEGLTQLIWAARDPQNRALRWRSFAYVEEWRSIQRKKEAGEQIDEERVKFVDAGLLKYGELHFTKKTAYRKRQNKSLPKNPYSENWTGHDFYYIFKEVEGDLIYRHIYRPFAAWHHWSPLSFERTLKLENKGILYCSSSPATSATVLASAFQCLWHTAELVNSHLELNFGERLKKAHDELVVWHREQNKQRI